MSIKNVKFGNIVTDAKHGIIVHGCNAQGVMGSGIALEIRNRFPAAYEAYIEKHTSSGLELGEIVFAECDNILIANAITQQFFGRDNKKYVSYEAIFNVFDTLADLSHNMGLMVHYPMIGAGLGGGNWAVISDIIDTAFSYSSRNNAMRTLWIKE